MKKILSILIIISALITLCSCKGPISDADAKAIALDLMEKEIILTKHIYGDEFKPANQSEYDQHKEDTTFYYAKVSENSVFTTKEQLENAIKAVYTEKVVSQINEFAFTGATSDDGTSIIARFYQPKGEDRLKIDVTSYGVYQLKTTAHIDTVKVKRSTRSMMEITMEYEVEGSDKIREMTIMLRKENDEWKLDSQTFAIAIK